MFRRSFKSFVIVSGLLVGAAGALANVDVDMGFSRPDNPADTEVVVRFEDANGNRRYDPVRVTIPHPCSATQKRNLIRDALIAAAHDVTDNGATGVQLTIHHLLDGTKVKFDPGTTKEREDKVVSVAAVQGTIEFRGIFDPFDQPSMPAIFTAGIVTDVGEIQVQVSAQELNFQTDGPIICQALFQRLAPRAPQYGAQVNYAGDRLEVYFDPAYTVTQGGIIFGTSSSSPGCSGGLLTGEGNDPQPCPEDINRDGIVDLQDLARVLAAYGTQQDMPGYDPEADLDGNGSVDLDDLSRVLAAFGRPCD
jgi:hypothetical protein